MAEGREKMRETEGERERQRVSQGAREIGSINEIEEVRVNERMGVRDS